MKDTGNALFLILIAVALFAALSYAITQSGRGGSGTKREQAALHAAQVLQYAGALKTTLNRMQLVNGCALTDISFEGFDDAGGYDYSNPNTGGDRCRVFHPDGGGQTPWTTQNWQGNPYAPFAQRFGGTWGIRDVGTDNAELLLYIGFTDPEICRALNRQLNVTMPDGELPTKFSGTPIPSSFQGVFADPHPSYDDWANATRTTLEPGHHEACFDYTIRDPANGLYVFYSVLVAR